VRRKENTAVEIYRVPRRELDVRILLDDGRTLVFTGPKRRIWGFWVDGGTRFVKWDIYDVMKGRGEFASLANQTKAL
jgi:hypothetical protein